MQGLEVVMRLYLEGVESTWIGGGNASVFWGLLETRTLCWYFAAMVLHLSLAKAEGTGFGGGSATVKGS